MKIISGGQTGVDRAALDAALGLGIGYGGWCPRGGWAEDLPQPPGLLARYPLLQETPLADPAQRTEWNVRDADAVLILVAAGGVAASAGTSLAGKLAAQYRRPLLVVDLAVPDAAGQAAAWIAAQRAAHGESLALGIGGPRESEAPGIYGRAKACLQAALQDPGAAARAG